ncbi:MAG: hypothetical protein AAB557_00775 [Patescibacteria group bacterium]
MAKKEHNGMRTKLIFLLVAAAAVVTLGGFIINNSFQSRQAQSGYQAYQDPTYGFTIKYPTQWEIRKDTHVFENGDAIAFGISGSTQKKNTELTHGAQVAVAKPFSIKTTLTAWIQDYFPPQATVSKMTLTKTPMESVESCSNLGCMTYYFTLVNNQVNGVAIFTEGPDKDKMVYENTTLYMLKSLLFDATNKNMISEVQAIANVKALPEVIAYLKRVPNGLVAINGGEGDIYMIQVYEIINRHTATFNWYTVNKQTGKITGEFDN